MFKLVLFFVIKLYARNDILKHIKPFLKNTGNNLPQRQKKLTLLVTKTLYNSKKRSVSKV